jgi:hypothetical protein
MPATKAVTDMPKAGHLVSVAARIGRSTDRTVGLVPRAAGKGTRCSGATVTEAVESFGSYASASFSQFIRESRIVAFNARLSGVRKQAPVRAVSPVLVPIPARSVPKFEALTLPRFERDRVFASRLATVH